ncbi:MAG: sel1 repeat family protein [Verrucomicrobia bacterium]|nr:sel1 repeat family protein [Verrucomicrobiota bacterium]
MVDLKYFVHLKLEVESADHKRVAMNQMHQNFEMDTLCPIQPGSITSKGMEISGMIRVLILFMFALRSGVGADIEMTTIQIDAERGDVRAMDKLGIMYASGLSVNRDNKQAKIWFRRAAEQEYPSSQYNYAVILHGEGDYPEAVRWLRKASSHGHVRSIHKLGEMYYQGQGVPLSPVEAYGQFIKNAQKGIPASMKWVAILWQNGEVGVEQNPDGAVSILKFLAEKGDAQSQVMLGNSYDAAVGVVKDDVQAIYWFRKAALQGSSIAQNNLAVLLSPRLLNDNPHADVVESFTWFNLAAADPSMDFAARQREKLRKHMTEEQIQLAEKNAVKFLPRPIPWNDFDPIRLPPNLSALFK